MTLNRWVQITGMKRDMASVLLVPRKRLVRRYPPINVDDIRDFWRSSSVGRYYDELPKRTDMSPFVRRVLDQGTSPQSGGCSAATACNIIFNRMGLHTRNTPSCLASPTFLYYHANALSRVDSGVSVSELVKVLHTRGTAMENLCPFTLDRCTPSDAADESAHLHKICTVRNLDGCVEATRMSIIAGFPVVVGFPVSSDIQQATPTGLIPDNLRAKVIGAHSVVVVGYDDVKRLFKFVNSWGNQWGDGGYGYFHYDFYKRSVYDSWAIIPDGDSGLEPKTVGCELEQCDDDAFPDISEFRPRSLYLDKLDKSWITGRDYLNRYGRIPGDEVQVMKGNHPSWMKPVIVDDPHVVTTQDSISEDYFWSSIMHNMQVIMDEDEEDVDPWVKSIRDVSSWETSRNTVRTKVCASTERKVFIDDDCDDTRQPDKIARYVTRVKRGTGRIAPVSIRRAGEIRSIEPAICVVKKKNRLSCSTRSLSGGVRVTCKPVPVERIPYEKIATDKKPTRRISQRNTHMSKPGTRVKSLREDKHDTRRVKRAPARYMKSPPRVRQRVKVEDGAVIDASEPTVNLS